MENKYRTSALAEEVFLKKVSVRDLLTPQEAVAKVQKIVYPETGGIEVYYRGERYPKKGFSYPEAVFDVAEVKRVFMVSLKFFEKNKRFIPVLLFGFRGLTEAFGSFSEAVLERHYLKDRYYCKSVRELKRVEHLHARNKTEKRLADFICVVFEYDTAYRYRLHDIAGEIDRERLHKNAAREVLRVLDIGYERENPVDHGYQKNKWKTLRRIIKIFMLHPFIRRRF